MGLINETDRFRRVERQHQKILICYITKQHAWELEVVARNLEASIADDSFISSLTGGA